MRFLILAIALSAMPAFAQVDVVAQLEKSEYLEGEPIVVIVNVTNIGEESVSYLGSCPCGVALTVVGVARRVPPDIFGCGSGFGGSVCGCGGYGTPLKKGQRISFRYLLREYSLKPGRYKLIVSGTPGASGNQTNPAPGSQLEQTLDFGIRKGEEEDLKQAMANYISEASDNTLRGIDAREAISESALPFQEPLIARFASEGNYSAIQALGRIGNAESRADLKKLYYESRTTHRGFGIMLTLACIGHPDDASFFAEVLRERASEFFENEYFHPDVPYAALGLGRIGGDESVRCLKDAIKGANPGILSYIIQALGNTRSRLAVPVLLDIYKNRRNPSAGSDVCKALVTLTHYPKCGDNYQELKRWWNKNGSIIKIYGNDSCPDNLRDSLPVVQ
jgi:hypothetical protein